MGRTKKVMEEPQQDFEIAVEEMEPTVKEVPIGKAAGPEPEKPVKTEKKEKELINCLSNTRVCVRYILRENGVITNPKHVLYGGMAENAKRTFVVPKLSSGVFVNVLTDSEKDYLEHALGLPDNALSVYKKDDNFWSTATEGGIAFVELKKQDNYLSLSNPMDYIKYKILLANKNLIAPSLQALQDNPKATYQFVIINEGEEAKASKTRMSYTMQCYKEYGKIENNVDIMRFLISAVTGRNVARNTPIEILQTKINSYIQSDAKNFLRLILDPLRDTKVLILTASEEGIISKRGTYYYIKDGNNAVPMCEEGEEPTLSIAARWLSSPRRQELKFNIEDKLNR